MKVALIEPAALAAALWEAPLVGTQSPYNALDRVGTVKSNGGLVTTTRTYATWSGQVTGHWVMANGTQAYGVDGLAYAATKLKHVHDRVTNGAIDYAYDANGRLASATAAGGTGTLAQSYSQGYSFSDAAWPGGATVGNLERVTASGVVTHYDYLQDRLVSTSNAAGATLTTNLHDHAGRLTSKRTAGVEAEGFAYDVQDQLRQVRRGGAVTEKLEYDPTGAPLYRMVGNQVVYYAGPFATVTALANTGCPGYGCAEGVAGVQVAAHVILAGSRIASVRAANVLYYHRDWQGSVVATTTTGGNVGVRYRYTPYGQLDRTDESISNAPNASELGYTGGLRLGWAPVTGTRQGDLLLLGARVYDAAMKRWLQPDTVDLLRYTYTSGDPVSFVDPSGREPVAPVPSAADWSHAAERPPSWVAFRGDGVEPGTVEGDPNCKSGPGGPECKLPPVDVPWPGKSPQQLKDEAERDLREFLGAATSVRADNARMAALASSVDRPNRPGYWRRVWRNIVLTNKVVPGMLVPPFTAGVLFWAFKVPADALVWGGVSPVAWALSGFRGATIGAATFTGLETGAIAGATAATNWALVGIAFEIGVGIGSMIQAAVED